MKPVLACQIEQTRFDTANDAHVYAKAMGIDPGFFVHSDSLPLPGPTRLFSYGSALSPTVVVIVYTLTLEIGLWVAPDYRNKGWGQKVFKVVIEQCIKPDIPSRLYAQVDSTNSSYSSAMRKILLATRFKPLTPGRQPQSLELWVYTYCSPVY